MGDKILLLGGGGHCRSILDTVRCIGTYTDIAIVAPDSNGIDDIPVIGTDDDLPRLFCEGWTDAFITLGSIGNPHRRRKLYELIREYNYHIPVLIDPTAIVAERTEIGEGSFIGKRAIINVGAVIGKCAIINSGAIIEHDCRIGEFVHVSPGAVLCGGVELENDVHVGASAVIKQYINIGKKSIIGMGSVVLKDIPEKVVAYGNPCKLKTELL